MLSGTDEAELLRLASSQPESAGELTELLERLKQEVAVVALDDERVRERLADTRHRVLTADYREDKADADEVRRLAEIGVYDYDNDVLVVAVVDLRSGAVTEVSEREGVAPPITAEELEEARELVAGVSGVRSALTRSRARVVAFPTPSYAFETNPDAQRHRGCVLYGRELGGETASVVVDLSARRVVPDDELAEILRANPSDRAEPDEED
jgi:hypothetical protein